MRRLSTLSGKWQLLGVLAIVGVLALGGTAWAYYTSSGSGSGQATSGTMSTVALVTATTSPTTPLLPGGTAGDVVIKVHNPNTFNVSIAAVTYTGGSIGFDAAHSGCSTTDSNPVVTLNVPAADLPLPVSAGATTSFDLANAVTMDVGATNNCQGATISIPVTITVHSS
jgi:hypothetical protein